MCNECHAVTGHLAQCPNAPDVDESSPIDFCDGCHTEIFPRQRVIKVDEWLVHANADCLYNALQGESELASEMNLETFPFWNRPNYRGDGVGYYE